VGIGDLLLQPAKGIFSRPLLLMPHNLFEDMTDSLQSATWQLSSRLVRNLADCNGLFVIRGGGEGRVWILPYFPCLSRCALRTLSELASYQACLLSYIGISLTVSIHILQQLEELALYIRITFLMIARPTSCEAHDRFWVKLDCGERVSYARCP